VVLACITNNDLAALGGLGTLILAAVAVAQIRESRRQTGAMESQVAAIRDVAEQELGAMREDIQASIEQGRAVREAARAQLQPIVFAHAYGGRLKGPDDGANLSAGQVGFRYRLANEGAGVALNIRHGVEVGGMRREYGDGMEVRSLRPGEELPITGAATPLAFAVVFAEDELPEGWEGVGRIYWARCENVFGERFETRNPDDPQRSATFTRIAEPDGPESE
jgi:hypothetical protein